MEPHTEKRRSPKWVKVLLALSLAVNLAIAGVVAGFVLRGGPKVGRGPDMGYAMPYVLALPRELRREVFGAVRRDEGVPSRRERREEYREMIAALRATPFDPGAVQVVLDRQSSGAVRVQGAAQAAWLNVVSGLSDAERVAYTERMEEQMQRRAPGKRGDRK